MHTDGDTSNGNYLQVDDLFDLKTIFDRYSKIYINELFVVTCNLRCSYVYIAIN